MRDFLLLGFARLLLVCRTELVIVVVVAERQWFSRKTWPQRLLTLLPGELADVIANLEKEEAEDFEKVKSSLLKKYRLSAEVFRRKFRKSEKSSETTRSDNKKASVSTKRETRSEATSTNREEVSETTLSHTEKGSEVTFSYSEKGSVSTLSSCEEGLLATLSDSEERSEVTLLNAEERIEAEPVDNQCTLKLDSSVPEMPKALDSEATVPDLVLKIPDTVEVNSKTEEICTGTENSEELSSDLLIAPKSECRDSLLINSDLAAEYNENRTVENVCDEKESNGEETVRLEFRNSLAYRNHLDSVGTESDQLIVTQCYPQEQMRAPHGDSCSGNGEVKVTEQQTVLKDELKNKAFFAPKSAVRLKLACRQHECSAAEEECACRVWPVRKLLCFLSGSRFIIGTDQCPLKWLFHRWPPPAL